MTDVKRFLSAIEQRGPAAAEHLMPLFYDELRKLAARNMARARSARLVRLRFYAGLSVEEAAETSGLSRSTAYEHWAYARAWLYCELCDG